VTIFVATQAAASELPLSRHAIIDPLKSLTVQQRIDFDKTITARKIDTVPTWHRSFFIKGTQYHYRLVGAAPSAATTSIPVVIIPIRLTVPADTGGETVFDAAKIAPHITSSPLFTALPSGGDMQFGDGLLRANFPDAPAEWHTLLAPTIGPTLDITAPLGTVRLKHTKSGNPFGYIVDSSIVNKPISAYLKANPQPHAILIFVTYNSVERFAFGYHSWRWGPDRRRALVYMYTSWFEGIGAVFGFPSPDAATLSHEIAETIFDPLITSVTREWGDPFNKNHCFDHLIEVGDAIEDAHLPKVYAQELGQLDGQPYLYTLQNEALLPWFERQTPSTARDGAYSFPEASALTAAAPMNCKR
jgi:hypothetical protein